YEYSSATEDRGIATDKPPDEWNAKERTQLIRRLLGGAKPAELADESGVDVAEIVAWRRRFVEGGRKALRPRFDGDDDDE
ncbi:MAG: helix-turn-helix domain-containing protein, partial [Acidimicrobiia bacterium]|nr:helix-turn-helix domain-containing protein [Acidimicrobiia bacterium]